MRELIAIVFVVALIGAGIVFVRARPGVALGIGLLLVIIGILQAIGRL